jgi:hypothetical protein
MTALYTSKKLSKREWTNMYSEQLNQIDDFVTDRIIDYLMHKKTVNQVVNEWSLRQHKRQLINDCYIDEDLFREKLEMYLYYYSENSHRKFLNKYQ